MTERTLLAWFFLFYISLHVQCVRTTIDEVECLKDGHEDNKSKDQFSEAVRLGQGDEEQPELHGPLVSLMTLHRGGSDMQAQGSHSLLARAQSFLAAQSSVWGYGSKRFEIALAGGCALQTILLMLLVVTYCYGSRSSSSTHGNQAADDEDDSDGSVLALGHGLDDFVWWDQSKARSMITPTSQPPRINLIVPPWSCDSLDNIFNECRLAESWMDARTDKLAEELTGELSEGKSSFFSQSIYGTEQTGLTCIIYVMQLALHYVPDNLILQEFTHAGNKNHFLTDDFRLPKTKLRNRERVEECFMRCLTVKLGLSEDIAEKFASSAVLLRADEEATTGSAAAAISNMSTNVRKLTFVVHLTDMEDKLRKDLGIDEGKLQVDARGMEFRWENVGEDYGLRKLLKKAPDARKVKPNWKASGIAVLPWSPSDVSKALSSHHIDPNSFEKELSELQKKLRTGHVQLGIEEASGNLVCVEHRVYLKLSKKNGDILVHEGDESTPASLPYVLLLANETPWIAALRAARSQLGSIFMRVELQLRAQEVHTTVTPEPPKMFADGKPIAFIVREFMVEALAS